MTRAYLCEKLKKLMQSAIISSWTEYAQLSFVYLKVLRVVIDNERIFMSGNVQVNGLV